VLSISMTGHIRESGRYCDGPIQYGNGAELASNVVTVRPIWGGVPLLHALHYGGPAGLAIIWWSIAYGAWRAGPVLHMNVNLP